MSARAGTLVSVTVPGVSRLAAISGRAAFLAPPISMVPWSGRPPSIRILSIGVAGAGLPLALPEVGAQRLRQALLAGGALRARPPRARRLRHVGRAAGAVLASIVGHAPSMTAAAAASSGARAALDLAGGRVAWCAARAACATARPHSSGVEHSLGKGEVESSNLSVGTTSFPRCEVHRVWQSRSPRLQALFICSLCHSREGVESRAAGIVARPWTPARRFAPSGVTERVPDWAARNGSLRVAVQPLQHFDDVWSLFEIPLLRRRNQVGRDSVQRLSDRTRRWRRACRHRRRAIRHCGPHPRSSPIRARR